METQLEKDVASNAGVIPIWPWLDENGKPKDCLPPNIYANMLLQAKRANGQDGSIIRCHHDGCEHDTKSMFWRSVNTSDNIVPEGWTNFGGQSNFTYCSTCRARDIQDIGLDEDMEYERVDANLKHGSTGSSGASDKPLRPLTVSPPIPTTTNIINLCPGNLKDRAREIFKNYPKHLEAVLKQIDDDERKKRANVAQDRKRKKDDEEYFNSKKKSIKTTEFKGPEGKFSLGKKSRKKKGGRRKKRTKKRRKSKRRKRTRRRRKSKRRKKR
jgi:hypothetical protein